MSEVCPILSSKDEVRSFGRELGIHNDLIMRHPFPGPGIAIRILGEVTPERVAIARAADNIFISMIKEAGIYDQGDARVYGYIVILRAVQTADFMSCEPFEFDFNLLKKISTRIVNEVEGVSRVVYDITSKPPGKSASARFHLEQESNYIIVGTIELE
ncbi:GMP synthase [Colletotrichum higginsianum]|nr:GMP synthase [Colletotrichum higginsianum]